MSTLLAGPETFAGLLLVFFAPGYFVTRALFPEWRLRPGDRLRPLLETVTLSFVLSIVLTVLVGEVMLVSFPGGFAATWSDPTLELVLTVVALVAFGVALARGAFAREPVAGPSAAPHPEEGPWELTRALDRVAAEERTVRRRLRDLPRGSAAAEAAQARIDELRRERETLGRRREEQYAE
jgi:uncharacterized membrane protein